MTAYKLNPSGCLNVIRQAMKSFNSKKILDDDINIACKFMTIFFNEEDKVRELVVNLIHAGRNDDHLKDFSLLLIKINIKLKYGELAKEENAIEIK
jgi:hypothetical protein